MFYLNSLRKHRIPSVKTSLKAFEGKPRTGFLLTYASFGYFLGNPSQPVSTVGTVFSLVRTLTAYLYRGSLTAKSTLGCHAASLRNRPVPSSKIPTLPDVI